jgi:hypothetical protein
VFLSEQHKSIANLDPKLGTFVTEDACRIPISGPGKKTNATFSRMKPRYHCFEDLIFTER